MRVCLMGQVHWFRPYLGKCSGMPALPHCALSLAAWTLVKSMGAGPRLLSCEFWTHHLLVLWLWQSFLSSLGPQNPQHSKRDHSKYFPSCHESKCVEHWEQRLVCIKCSVNGSCWHVVTIISQDSSRQVVAPNFKARNRHCWIQVVAGVMEWETNVYF